MKLSSINISYLITYVHVQSILAGNEKLRHLLLLLLLFLLPRFWNLVLIFYLEPMSVWTGCISSVSSHTWPATTTLDSPALDALVKT